MGKSCAFKGIQHFWGALDVQPRAIQYQGAYGDHGRDSLQNTLVLSVLT